MISVERRSRLRHSMRDCAYTLESTLLIGQLPQTESSVEFVEICLRTPSTHMKSGKLQLTKSLAKMKKNLGAIRTCQHYRVREIGRDFDKDGKFLRLERCERCGLLMREYLPT